MIAGLAKIRQANAELHALYNWTKLYTEQRREQLSARKWGAGQLSFNAFFVPVTQLGAAALIWYWLIEDVTGRSVRIGRFHCVPCGAGAIRDRHHRADRDLDLGGGGAAAVRARPADH